MGFDWSMLLGFGQNHIPWDWRWDDTTPNQELTLLVTTSFLIIVSLRRFDSQSNVKLLLEPSFNNHSSLPSQCATNNASNVKRPFVKEHGSHSCKWDNVWDTNGHFCIWNNWFWNMEPTGDVWALRRFGMGWIFIFQIRARQRGEELFVPRAHGTVSTLAHT